MEQRRAGVPNSIKEGSALGCVYNFVQQGMPIQEVLLGCDFSGKTPEDPDQDPCVPLEVEAEVLRGVVSPGDVCGGLIALTSEDQCVSSGTHPSVIYAKFRGKDIEEIMRIGQEKLDGPVGIIPMLGPGTSGPDPGPRPEIGETSPNPDLL